MSAGKASLRSLEASPYFGREALFSTNHGTGWFGGPPKLQMGFVDGSVRSFSYSLTPELFEALVTVAGKEQIPAWDQFE